MILFDINGAVIKFNEKRDNYNTIRKLFLEYAQKSSDEFKDYCDHNLTTLRQINDDYLNFAEALVDQSIKKGVEILVSYNVIVVDFKIFKETYCEKYFDFKRIFNNFVKEKNSINKNKRNTSRLFDIKPFVDRLSRSLYRDCFNIHMAVIDVLLEYGVTDVESYIDAKSIKQANALFNNYKDGFISKPDSYKIVQKIIMANPYRKDVYEFLIREDGDFGCELERLTKYLGYDIKPYKAYLMDMYIKDLVEEDISDLEIAKEKVKKYAKYIGCENDSIYITRIDAIYTFENA